jgi:hypothetical protein
MVVVSFVVLTVVVTGPAVVDAVLVLMGACVVVLMDALVVVLVPRVRLHWYES